MQEGQRPWKILRGFMRTRPTKTELTIATALIVLGVLVASCRHEPVPRDSFRLRLRYTEAQSPQEIEAVVRNSLMEKYPAGDIASGYTMHHVTNGPSAFLFIQAWNAPRGLSIFNLYCYERARANLWLLRGYVPVNEYYYTNSPDRALDFRINGGYVNAVFRGHVIFSILADHESPGGHVK
jgi:hypothetical protein